VKRVLLGLVVLALAAGGVYWFGLRGSSTPSAEAKPPQPVAQIGEGKSVIVVAGDGRLLGAAAGKSKKHLVVLPLKESPKGKRVRGHVLEQVRIVAAAPKPLRRYLARSGYGETGVDVETNSGIQIRFGDEREATRKWKAAAAVLADPAVTLLSYVDVSAPTRPVTGGNEHELPPAS
jgi:cell division septal protein FtsQ